MGEDKLEQLPINQRADFLKLALRFLNDDAKPQTFERQQELDPLYGALNTFQRIEGRAALERAYAESGRGVSEHRRHSDELFAKDLGGPALELAQKELEDARRVS